MSSHPLQLQVGSFIGDYEIVSVVGQGGMGKVFKVRNVLSDRIEAMKVVLPDLEGSGELVERFLREIKVVARLEHPNIACLRTALRVGNQVLMVMEFVDGSSLSAMLKGGQLDVTRAVNITLQVLSALGHAHQLGVVHRDVKPANILVGVGEQVKLTDFGIASRSGDPKLTAAGTAVGSLYYMSPEQMKAESVDARSDLYSVGATLYEMVTGRRPVPGESFYSILKAHSEQKPIPVVEFVPQMPRALSNIIERSLEKTPQARFQSAEDFRAALMTLGFEKQPLEPPAEARPDPETLISRSWSPAPTMMRQTLAKTTSGTESKAWDPVMLENVRKNLAVYIGPMAQVLVSRAAKTARTTEELYRTLASEIAEPSDREKFLRSQPF